MKPGAVAMVSGPVDPADWWQAPARQLAAEIPVLAPHDECVQPPFGIAWIASLARELHAASPAGPVVFAAHGTAGPLVPGLAGTQRAAGRHVGGYVFVDATLPRPGPQSHMDLLRAAAPEEAERAHAHLHGNGVAWPDDDRLARPRGHDFWMETLPPVSDWPDAPCAYIYTQLPAPGCGDTAFWARTARARGWPVISAEDMSLADAVRLALAELPG